MNRSVIIFVLIFCGMLTQAIASNSPVFVLKRKNNRGQIPDSITVSFQRENISMNYGKVRIYKGLKPDKNGRFRFSLPEIQHLTMFDVVFYANGQIIRSNKYFAAPSDRIDISYTVEQRVGDSKPQKDKVSLDFSGRGHIKYKVRDLLKSEFSMLWASLGNTNDLSMTTCSQELTKRMHYIFERIQASDQKAVEILNTNRIKLGEDLTNFYICEFDMSSNTFATYIFDLFNRVTSIECKKLIADYYFSKSINFQKDPVTKLIAFSHHYVVYKGDQLMLEAVLKNGGNVFTFESRYDNLKATSNSIVRDRLVTDFLLNPYLQKNIKSFSNRDSCLMDALKMITAKHLTETLKQQMVYKKGNQIYDFSFIDTIGNLVKAKDLEGKVFMIDFYGEGCGGCAKFSQRFKEFIYPEFAGNKQFEVVCVSVDRTRDRWIRAMNSGLYSQKSYINLNTGPIGFSHPMLTYYHVNGIPFILLVDKNGKLISRIESHSNAEIAGMIREALGK